MSLRIRARVVAPSVLGAAAAVWLGCSLHSNGLMTSVFEESDAGDAGEDVEYEPAADELALLDLGGELSPGDSTSDKEACVAESCVDLQYECGAWNDGCGKSLDCGICMLPQSCHAGRCASVVYVDAKATGAATGKSWKDAFTTIDQALAVAKPKWQVWVAKGTYVSTKPTPSNVLTMPTGVELYGHFKGTEDAIAQRDFASKDETLLDGQKTTAVVTGAADSVLDGFTIANGWATNGAGLSVNNVTGMTIANCVIKDNISMNAGGGLFVQLAGVTVRSTTIASNQAASSNLAGGVYIKQSQATFDHCVVWNNSAGTGGGLYALQSDLVVDGSVFLSNRADYSQSGGGGIFLEQAKTARIVNSVIAKNASTYAFGGGIYNLTSSPDIVNCTFALNTALIDGADVFDNIAAIPRISNSILWSSGSPHPVFDYVGAGPAIVRYSDVLGGWPGVGNITVDPLFANPGAGDYKLGAGSPCIDAADGALAPAVDLLGTKRWDDPAHVNTGVGPIPYADLGALEFHN